MAEEVFREVFAPGAVVGGDGLFAAVVDVEAGMFPGEQVGEFFRADELGFAEGVEELVPEEFDGGVKSSAGMQWKRPSGVKSPSAARTAISTAPWVT